jgi:hypothetical protein
VEPEGSIPRSQEPATGTYVDPEEFSPQLFTLLLQDQFNIILSSTSRSSAWYLSFTSSNQNFVRIIAELTRDIINSEMSCYCLLPCEKLISQISQRRNTQISFFSGIAQWYSSGLRAGWSGFRIPAEAGNFFITASRPALGSTQPPNQRVPGALSLGSKAAGAWSWPLT